MAPAPKLFRIAGALSPAAFFGWWWIPLSPAAYWLITRVITALPSDKQLADLRARENETFFFLAAFSGLLKAGIPILQALSDSSTLLESSLKTDIEKIYALLLLGAQPEQAWQVLRGDRQLSGLAAQIPRAQNLGLALDPILERIVQERYESALFASKAKVKSLSVKLALPVGLCFLPSFLIGGVGPVIYFIFRNLQIF